MGERIKRMYDKYCYSICTRLLFTLLVLLMSSVLSSAEQLELSIEGLLRPVWGAPGWPSPAAHQGAINVVNIAFGDPLGFKIVLENKENNETAPFLVHLGPLIPGHMLLQHPDGKRYSIKLYDGVRLALVPRRPMVAYEKLEQEFILYDRSPDKFKYIFPAPARYIMYILYFTGFCNEPIDWRTAEDGELLTPLEILQKHDGVLVSNPLVINVGPPFIGWNDLQREGLVDAVMGRLSFKEFSDRIGQERLEILVRAANRPWLTTWSEAVKSRNRQRSLEAEQNAEQQRRREAIQAIRESARMAMGEFEDPRVLFYPRQATAHLDRDQIRRGVTELESYISRHPDSPMIPAAYRSLGWISWQSARNHGEDEEEMLNRSLEMFSEGLKSAEAYGAELIRLDILDMEGYPRMDELQRLSEQLKRNTGSGTDP